MGTLIFTAVIQIVVILLSCWFQSRHLKASKLKHDILVMCTNHNIKSLCRGKPFDINYNTSHWCYDFLPPAHKMALSRKPITIESYLKESEIKELTVYENT